VEKQFYATSQWQSKPIFKFNYKLLGTQFLSNLNRSRMGCKQKKEKERAKGKEALSRLKFASCLLLSR